VKKLWQSKKFKVLLGTLILDAVAMYLGPEWREFAVKVITILGMTYIGAQGVADGLSKGATAS
jgi:hypothetical protein